MPVEALAKVLQATGAILAMELVFPIPGIALNVVLGMMALNLLSAAIQNVLITNGARMPKIPLQLQKQSISSRLSSRLSSLASEIVDRPVGINPAILLHGNIPQPMHGVAPRAVLGAAWWNKERKAAYSSTNHHCEACGVNKWEAKYHQWLEGHEVYEIDYMNGLMVYVRTAPLCHFCHSYIHSGRLNALFEQGLINHHKYASIVQHGDQVLRNANLTRQPQYPGPFAPWDKWRMIVNGKKYPPKFKTLAAWEKGHRLKSDD